MDCYQYQGDQAHFEANPLLEAKLVTSAFFVELLSKDIKIGKEVWTCEKTANKHAAYKASEPLFSCLSFITMFVVNNELLLGIIL